MFTLRFDVAYDIGDIVYLKIAQERSPGMVTGYIIRPEGSAILYYVAWEDGYEKTHFALELCSEYSPGSSL